MARVRENLQAATGRAESVIDTGKKARLLVARASAQDASVGNNLKAAAGLLEGSGRFLGAVRNRTLEARDTLAGAIGYDNEVTVACTGIVSTWESADVTRQAMAEKLAEIRETLGRMAVLYDEYNQLAYSYEDRIDTGRQEIEQVRGNA